VAPLAGETSSQHCPGPTLAWSLVLSLAWSLVLSLVGRLVKSLEVTPAYAPAGAPACTCVKARTRPTLCRLLPVTIQRCFQSPTSSPSRAALAVV
jgi:hypothetical protein